MRMFYKLSLRLRSLFRRTRVEQELTGAGLSRHRRHTAPSKLLGHGTGRGPFLEVVGVAKDGKYLTISEDPQSYFYVPLAQDFQERSGCA
jgi:hypothetical protein